MKALLLLLVILPALGTAEAKRVVFFPFFQASHIASFARVGQALAELNHEIYLCMPQFTLNKGIINVTNIRVVPYGQDLGDVDGDYFRDSGLATDFWSDSNGAIQMMLKIPPMTNELMSKILTSTSFVSALEEIKPDFFVIDSMPLLSNSLVLPYKFDVPFATMGMNYNVIAARVPFSPAAVPCVFFQEGFNNQPTFFQRLKKAFMYFMMLFGDAFWDPKIAGTLVPGKVAPSSSRSILIKASVVLVENDVVLGYAYPMLPNTIMIGGTSTIPAKPLPEKFEKILKSARNGIAVVSFGSAVASFPPDVVTKITQALQTLSIHSVWRVNITSPDKSKITTSTWLPQNDLLGHRNGNTTRIFISHCGGWGQYEALYHGVPMLCLPMFADQFFNAHRIHDKGFGRFADIRTISTGELASLIHEVAYNDTYRNNIRKASELYKELYKDPLHDAAYWLDHVMRTGGLHLRSVGQDLQLYQFLLLDVLAFAALCIFSLVSLFALAVWCCCTKCRRGSKTKKRVKGD